MATNVYRGSDGTISVAVEAGLEGDKAQAVNDAYSLTPIGRVTGVTVRVTNDVRAFHELGSALRPSCAPATSMCRAPSTVPTSTAPCSS